MGCRIILSKADSFSPIQVVDCNTIFMLYTSIFLDVSVRIEKKAPYCVNANEPVADIFNRSNMIGKNGVVNAKACFVLFYLF